MSTKWRRFEVMLPRQLNDGKEVPEELLVDLVGSEDYTHPT
jgi:hypothetical protein